MDRTVGTPGGRSLDPDAARERLVGCYVTIPTMFRDGDLEVDLPAIRRHVGFLIDGGITTGNGVLLACGAAGDFTTLTFDERLRVTDTVVQEAAGRVPVVMGAQTTSTRELVEFARAAEGMGAEYIQTSPPFYFEHTEDDFFEYIVAATDSAEIGVIVYNTHWTSYGLSLGLIERLAEIPKVVGLKWSTPDNGFMEFEKVVSRYSHQFSIIDNQLRFAISHMLGARAIEVHVCNYWPQWGVRLWDLLQNSAYVEAQQELMRVALPFMELWEEILEFTGGDGYLDKLCMEVVGLGSSRCRPPTRDVRGRFLEPVKDMLSRTGVPGLLLT